MSIFEVLAGQSVLCFLNISIMSSKKAKRLFLTPDGPISEGVKNDFLWHNCSQMFFIGKVNYHVNCQLPSYPGSNSSLLALRPSSHRNLLRTFLTPVLCPNFFLLLQFFVSQEPVQISKPYNTTEEIKEDIMKIQEDIIKIKGYNKIQEEIIRIQKDIKQ